MCLIEVLASGDFDCDQNNVPFRRNFSAKSTARGLCHGTKQEIRDMSIGNDDMPFHLPSATFAARPRTLSRIRPLYNLDIQPSVTYVYTGILAEGFMRSRLAA